MRSNLVTSLTSATEIAMVILCCRGILRLSRVSQCSVAFGHAGNRPFVNPSSSDREIVPSHVPSAFFACPSLSVRHRVLHRCFHGRGRRIRRAQRLGTPDTQGPLVAQVYRHAVHGGVVVAVVAWGGARFSAGRARCTSRRAAVTPCSFHGGQFGAARQLCQECVSASGERRQHCGPVAEQCAHSPQRPRGGGRCCGWHGALCGVGGRGGLWSVQCRSAGCGMWDGLAVGALGQPTDIARPSRLCLPVDVPAPPPSTTAPAHVDAAYAAACARRGVVCGALRAVGAAVHGYGQRVWRQRSWHLRVWCEGGRHCSGSLAALCRRGCDRPLTTEWTIMGVGLQ